MGSTIWETINNRGKEKFPEICGKCVENTMKAALANGTYDNITGIIIALRNLTESNIASSILTKTQTPIRSSTKPKSENAYYGKAFVREPEKKKILIGAEKLYNSTRLARHSNGGEGLKKVILDRMVLRGNKNDTTFKTRNAKDYKPKIGKTLLPSMRAGSRARNMKCICSFERKTTID